MGCHVLQHSGHLELLKGIHVAHPKLGLISQGIDRRLPMYDAGNRSYAGQTFCQEGEITLGELGSPQSGLRRRPLG
jgi:hypothetical protein